MNKLPDSDEPAFYLEIKEVICLVIITEQNMEKIPGDKIGFRINTLGYENAKCINQ